MRVEKRSYLDAVRYNFFPSPISRKLLPMQTGEARCGRPRCLFDIMKQPSTEPERREDMRPIRCGPSAQHIGLMRHVAQARARQTI